MTMLEVQRRPGALTPLCVEPAHTRRLALTQRAPFLAVTARVIQVLRGFIKGPPVGRSDFMREGKEGRTSGEEGMRVYGT